MWAKKSFNLSYLLIKKLDKAGAQGDAGPGSFLTLGKSH